MRTAGRPARFQSGSGSLGCWVYDASEQCSLVSIHRHATLPLRDRGGEGSPGRGVVAHIRDDEEEVDSELNLDDVNAYEQALDPVLAGPAQDTSAEPAWEVRTNAAPMTMAEILRGRNMCVVLASVRNMLLIFSLSW